MRLRAVVSQFTAHASWPSFSSRHTAFDDLSQHQSTAMDTEGPQWALKAIHIIKRKNGRGIRTCRRTKKKQKKEPCFAFFVGSLFLTDNFCAEVTVFSLVFFSFLRYWLLHNDVSENTGRSRLLR